MTQLACVLDASVAVRFFVEGPDSDKARAVFKAIAEERLVAHIPSLFYLEVANGLWKQTKFAGLPTTNALEFLEHLMAIEMIVYEPQEDLKVTTELALITWATVYDSVYMAIANRLGLPMITGDSVLARLIQPDVCRIVLLEGADKMLAGAP